VDNHQDENTVMKTSDKWLRILLPCLSTIFGGGALWYSWFSYTHLANQADAYWYQWIQPVFIGLTGILCLIATILFLLGSSSGRPVLEFGLSIIPLLLFFNLVILPFRVVQNLIQGNTGFLFDRLLSQPYKLILIPVIVIALIWLEALSKSAKRNA
jgi:hypothetical protein